MNIKISVSPATFILLVCMIATTPLPSLFACLSAAFLHELGHVAAARICSIELSRMNLDVLGARLTTGGKLYSYDSIVFLCISGPLVNFLFFALTLPLCDTSPWCYEFCLSSLCLGLLNLIPIEGFDGGRILHGLLCKLLPLDIAEGISKALSFCCILGLWMLSVWMLLRTGSSLTLFVFSCCLFGMLFV